MKRMIVLGCVTLLVLSAALYSRQQPVANAVAVESNGFTPAFKVAVEEKNPWTSLSPNVGPDQFQFAVVTDRTGGHRAKIFSRAVKQINLLQPEFVMSVGDLIEGYSTDMERVGNEWKEFESYIKNFQMPFFYVPGNHDLTNKEMISLWGGRYGRSYYHFLYRDVLFLAVNSEDGQANTISEEQQQYFRKALAENPNVRWTLVFLHKPMWTQQTLAENGWLEMEKMLSGRKYTVFCGHVHRYQKYVRNGMNYYQLATTGGGSRLRGVRYGEFDHIAWITMKEDGPLIANVMLDGIYPENLQTPESDEAGVPERKRVQTYAVKGKVTIDGKPTADVIVRLHSEEGARGRAVSDGLSEEDGTFKLSTYSAFDGAPEGEFRVTVVKYKDGVEVEGAKGENLLPEKFADPRTSGIKVKIAPDNANSISLDISTK